LVITIKKIKEYIQENGHENTLELTIKIEKKYKLEKVKEDGRSPIFSIQIIIL